jgi:hypothetical protein
MRGGKPQLFYAGICKTIPEKDLKKRFSKKSKKKPIKIYLNKSIKQIDEEISSYLHRNDYTVEFAANWYYCKKLYISNLE